MIPWSNIAVAFGPTLLIAVFNVAPAGWTLNCSMYNSDSTDCVSERSGMEVASPKMSTIGRLGRCGLVEIRNVSYACTVVTKIWKTAE